MGLGRYREQASGEGRSRLPAAFHRDLENARHIGLKGCAALEQCDDRPERPELCRRPGQDFRRRAQPRRNAFRAGCDRRRARRRCAAGRISESRGLWRPGQRPAHRRCVEGRAGLRAHQRSRRRARAAAAAERGRLRQARRQAAGENRRALQRQQPARHHVEPRRHGVRQFPGWRDPRPQCRAG